MITISLCMIVKNEEQVIERCLNCVKDLVDEIVIIDTGSTDQTKEIVSRVTDFVYDFEWIDDFAAARNFSFTKASKDYILWLDADDVISTEDQQKLLQLKESLSLKVDAVSMDYHVEVNENGDLVYGVKRNRLFKRDKNFKWVGKVHEIIYVTGETYDTDIVIQHKPILKDSKRNLLIYEKMVREGEELSPRDQYLYADELMYQRRFSEAIRFFEKFLESGYGNVQACCKLSDCYHFVGDTEQSEKWELRAFSYGIPTPELCCRIGQVNMTKKDYKSAIFWYKLAISKDTHEDTARDKKYETLVPHLQLSMCYMHLRNHKLAQEHNEIARKYNSQIPTMYV